MKQLRRVIDGVLVSSLADLCCLPKETLPLLATKLYSSGLINETVKNEPSMDRCISEFKASLLFQRSVSNIQMHCIKLLKSFIAVGGSFAAAANVLKEDLIEAVNNELNCNFNIELC